MPAEPPSHSAEERKRDWPGAFRGAYWGASVPRGWGSCGYLRRGGWQYLEGEADHVSIERLGSPHCSRHPGKGHGAQTRASMGAFFVWVCLGVFHKPVCAPMTNGIYVCQRPG